MYIIVFNKLIIKVPSINKTNNQLPQDTNSKQQPANHQPTTNRYNDRQLPNNQPTISQEENPRQQNNTEEKPKQVFVHDLKNCRPYCKKNGTDDSCALRCNKCKRWGHPADLCGKIYCCKCDSTDHKFCGEKKINK